MAQNLNNALLKKKKSLLEHRIVEKEQTMHTLLSHLNNKCQVFTTNKMKSEKSGEQDQESIVDEDVMNYKFEKGDYNLENYRNYNTQDQNLSFQSKSFGAQRQRYASYHQDIQKQQKTDDQIKIMDSFQSDNYLKVDNFSQKQQQNASNDHVDYFITQKDIISAREPRLAYIPKRIEQKAEQVQSHSNINGQLYINASIARSKLRTSNGSRFAIDDQKKEYKICKFDEHEFKQVVSNSFQQELQDLDRIQEFKKSNNQQPYIEQVLTFNLKFNKKQKIIEDLKRKKEMNQLINQQANNTLSGQAKGSNSQSRTRMSPIKTFPTQDIQKSLPQSKSQKQDAFKNFTQMSIYELRQHEKGILNLYEQNSHNRPQRLLHNKPESGSSNIFDIRLSQVEYDSIFDNAPSFQEKKAFIEVFRKKWKEDKGYCSMFDKRQAFRQAMLEKRKSMNKILNALDPRESPKRRPQTSMATQAGKRNSSQINAKKSVSPMRKIEDNFPEVSEIIDINVSGNTAQIHNPIQNSDTNNLNQFIQQLYQQPPLENKIVQNSRRSGMNFISKRISGNYNRDLSSSNIVSRAEFSSYVGKLSQKDISGDRKGNESKRDYQIKQVISLPQAKRRKNTSQPYSPASQKFISPDQSVRQLESQGNKNYESEKEFYNEQSQQYLSLNRIENNKPQAKSAFYQQTKNNQQNEYQDSSQNFDDKLKQSSYPISQTSIAGETEPDKPVKMIKDVTQPAIFTLPQNPISSSHFKYNFVKNKIESTRMENLSMSASLQYKLDEQRVNEKFQVLNQKNFQMQDQIRFGAQNVPDSPIERGKIHNFASSSLNARLNRRGSNQYVKMQKLIKQRNTMIINEYDKKMQYKESLEQKNQSFNYQSAQNNNNNNNTTSSIGKEGKQVIISKKSGKSRPKTSGQISVNMNKSLGQRAQTAANNGNRIIYKETNINPIYNQQDMSDLNNYDQVVSPLVAIKKKNISINEGKSISSHTNPEYSKLNSKELLPSINLELMQKSQDLLLDMSVQQIKD
ncbi:UNKNOWN [Stylonychia lemnae]|uniref:Uncharacterized protein n=1 Tax=Stylonychia lemnae TaxID=5949 RepID=A0A078AC07_STYLE|nr:UNKNOWN [Stylonychia lemnae]|eukprot:CDW79371.1 UNKNOWN [Stylonychia lemnae]